MEKSSHETIELEMAFLVRRVTSMTSSSKSLGMLDRSAYLFLHHITSHGPAGVKALADEFQLDISTASRQAAALEQKEFLYRIPDPHDGRAYSLQITELGLQEYLDYKTIRINKMKTVLHEWSEDDRMKFGELLRKFNRSFR
ncbi:MarR family transcriptional regulator [Paenibacillus albiflavus]|uniref:MarR family transcriptional regulator n=1 Tax=Paenibacillus albiflavus TaxID=2545760 RepID=A0A4R4E8I1_9BACL|nr:MarR family transcriptional regulator [Paenibacillus albiflavus]TCZ75273.1 MarR family transcriptional regulator [Paenibacillus albiflavus]